MSLKKEKEDSNRFDDSEGSPLLVILHTDATDVPACRYISAHGTENTKTLALRLASVGTGSV